MKRILLTFSVAACSLGLATVAQAQDDVVFDVDTLKVTSGDQSHTFNVEVADTPDETARGLMFRESMAEDAGMLFEFDPPREPQMWMKNTLIPLDMLFLDEAGQVIAIARSAQPGSLRRITPGTAVKGVLELNGGQAKALDIQAGAIVHHEIFGNVLETVSD